MLYLTFLVWPKVKHEFPAIHCLLLSKIQMKKLKSCNLEPNISKNIAMVSDHLI